MLQDHKLAPVEEYKQFVGAEMLERLKEKAKPLQELHVTPVNSTFCDVGVAVLLGSLTLLMNNSDIEKGWRVIYESPNFFSVSKKMHDALQAGERQA